ncbi:MAG: DNA polymerase III subunit [Clostridia bacterium]|nr:DNA polymerase III subunit [Clostridia bacterium]
MSFPLVGNNSINTSITNALKEHRLPHAILIEGEKGNGKHTLAFYLARAIVCDNENAPCGKCRNCAMGINHPDISVTAPEENKKNISVSQVRELKNEAYIKPHMASRRVFIIDFADTLNEQSQNALLKVLEEPPVSSLFILIAESKASLLETIISRCVVLTLNTPEKSQALEYIKSSTKYPDNEILEALINSRNNIGKALDFLAGKADSKTSVAAKEFLECFLRDDAFGMLTATAPFEKSRIETDSFFKDLKYFTAERLKQNPKDYRAVSLSKLYSLLCELEKSLITNINLSLLFCTLTSRAEQITGIK